MGNSLEINISHAIKSKKPYLIHFIDQYFFQNILLYNLFGTIGNHDYNGAGLLSEFWYYKSGWRIDDFFYNHVHTAEWGQKIGFVHIDTSFLVYGPEGEESKPLMAPWFKKYIKHQ